MPTNMPAGRGWPRQILVLGLALGVSLQVGCLKTRCYLEPTVKEVPATEFKKPAPAKPAHMAFEFRTKGAPNASVTAAFSEKVKRQVQESGLFADLDVPASPEVGLLSIAIDNVSITNSSDAAAKGFLTGLTFGMVGSSVSEGYICTVTYLAPGAKDAIVKTSRHAIHFTIGNANPPAGVIPAASAQEAVDTMFRQVLSHGLHDLSVDPKF